MNRIYVFFQIGDETLITNHLREWQNENNFEYIHYLVNPINNESGIISKNFKTYLSDRNIDLSSFYELVLLPLIFEPDDLESAYRLLNDSETLLRQEITTDHIDNVYLFPILKIKNEEKDNKIDIIDIFLQREQKKHTAERILTGFIFQDERMSGEKYQLKNWLNDIEGFIHLIPVIEKDTHNFFNYFPNVIKRELSSFSSKFFYSQNFGEIKKFVYSKLRQWILNQTTEEKEHEITLLDYDREIEKIKEIMQKELHDAKNNEKLIIPSFEFFTSLKFSSIKSNIKEFKSLDITKKIKTEAEEKNILVEKAGQQIYESCLKKVVNLKDFPSETLKSISLKKLRNAESNVNSLIKNCEKNLHHKIDRKINELKKFSDLLEKEVQERGIQNYFSKIIKTMEKYNNGLSRAKIFSIFFLGLIFSFAGFYGFYIASNIKADLIIISAASIFLEILIVLAYNFYWKKRLRQRLQRWIRILNQEITKSIHESHYTCIHNYVQYYFNRYVLRKYISIKTNYGKLKDFLASIKEHLSRIKELFPTEESNSPPAQIKEELEKINFNNIFTALDSWDNYSIYFFLKSMTNQEIHRIYRTTSSNDKIDIDSTIIPKLRKYLTVPVDENDIKNILLFPETLALENDPQFPKDKIYKIDSEGYAIAISLAKIREKNG
jgi:hypothetical protein